MNQHWPNAPAAPPAAMISPVEAWKKKLKICGIVMAVCAGMHLLSCLMRLVTSFFTGTLMRVYFAWLESMSPTVKLGGLLGPVERYLDRIAVWQAVATLPYLACAIWLLVLGLKMIKADPAALAGARIWSFGAAGAIVVSTAVQLAVIVPATQAYTEDLMNSMPAARAGSPFDMRQFMGSFTSAATAASTIMSVVALAVFPIGLYFWTKKLRTDAPAGV